MAALASDLRRQLENVCVQARELAEAAARSALQKRAVDAAEPFTHFTDADRELRTRLRARGRQVGDVRYANKTQTIDQLAQELAYEYWHRMLFARFLAENNLLMHPDGVAVSLEECEELAKSEKAPNGFVLAARYASRMLPQVFRTDDVLLEIEYAPEQRIALEKELSKLPRATFLADDSLGWVYQFWQAKRKDEVNDSGEKIDGRTLPAVTQLFTEHYMVQFLLHNTIGAWWCARHGIQGPPCGAGVPAGEAPVEMEYLRWRDDGTPAAGKFEGWPKTLNEFTMLDPCCGSGHFLVSAFNLLVPLRMHDEGLSARDACDTVLRENLFGLELDPRCTQIAAFALALAAWKYPSEDGQTVGYRQLPPLNIACSGQGVSGRREEWLTLAGDDSRLRDGMEKLYDLFRQAPHLGSLIDPRREAGDMFMAGFHELRPLIEKALMAENKRLTADFRAVGVAAQGIAKAASVLGNRYTLVTTNVPYLSRQKHEETLRCYCDDRYEEGKADLATAFVQRCLNACANGGSIALVTPHNWLFLGSYKTLREQLLRSATWNLAARLGPGAFETITGEVVNVALPVITRVGTKLEATKPTFSYIDVSSLSTVRDKQNGVLATNIIPLVQYNQLRNPDSIISPDTRLTTLKRLGEYAIVYQGISTTDGPRFVVRFWELPQQSTEWERFQLAAGVGLYSGLHGLIFWQQGKGVLSTIGTAKKGREAWGKRGFGISVTGSLYVSRYMGTPFDGTLAVVVPKNEHNVEAIGRYLTSDQFVSDVRSVDQAMSVTESSFAKVPFDLAYWQDVAAKEGPLPSPSSDDPTQWLFKGDISSSTDPLQVAVARLLGFRWPEQTREADAIDKVADKDGIVCIPAVRSKAPAAERLLEVLRTVFGSAWKSALLDKLLTDTGCKAGTSLDDWLRNQFFEQHFKRFHHRPFIWHIWDGRKDGFSCLVNYHKLNHKTLENLTYSYLGDWIKTQNSEAKAGKVGADLRLAAAQALQEKLKLILAGDPPYDIFVRWKPLSEQAIGWNPDLNDGVRMNIRSFVQADLLRKTPNIKWTKDRGKEPERDRDEYPWFWKGKELVGDRVNDVHLSNAEKLAVREGAK
jgi:hypothetical protein